MKHKIVFVVLLMSMCLGQEKPASEEPGMDQPQVNVEERTPTEVPQPTVTIPEDTIQDMIQTYFEALNQKDLDTLERLTHPFYVADIQPFMEYVNENEISFEIISVSLNMGEKEFREMMMNLSDEEFAREVGNRGLSFELELTVVKQGKSYHDFLLFVEVGETEGGWKIVDPYILQLMIETELELMESEE